MDPSLEGLDDVLAGSLLVAIGLAAAVLSFYRRRGADPLLASFGLFSALYGLRLLIANPLSGWMGIPTAVSIWTSQVITYVILVPAWYFFWQLLGDGWHRLSYWWVRVVAIFAVAGIASDLVLGRPGTLGTLNNIMVLLGLVVVVLGFWNSRNQMNTDRRILASGMTVFGLFAVNENLVPLGLLPWTWRGETVGFLIYVGCLGWIAARNFVKTERKLAGVDGELEAARKIQASILPNRAPTTENLAVATRFQPSSAVAGDFFEFLTPATDRTGVLIADVSGHGVPAALIASMVKVATKSHLASADRPAELLSKVNQTLCGSFQHGFVSAAYLLLDLDKREALSSSGGHPYPLLHRRSASKIQEIGGSGAILGRFPDATFKQETVRLEPGDRWILYTDGIVEAINRDQEMFGEERLRASILRGEALSVEQLCDSLMAEVQTWTGNGASPAREDDLTLVVVDYLPGVSYR